MWVRRGPWNRIRFFHDGPAEEHRNELHNLDTDLGETRNLAAQEPARVRELDALIDGHLRAINPVLPKPNRSYDPQAKAPPVGRAKSKAKADAEAG